VFSHGQGKQQTHLQRWFCNGNSFIINHKTLLKHIIIG
jgi:hypothetical protein